jgi:hypothetical protein
MSDEDTDAGGDLFVSMATVLIVIFLFVLFVVAVGSILWWVLS